MGNYLTKYNTYLPVDPKHDRYGYKGTNVNMQCCNDFQFELDKWYVHEGGIAPCISGFHLCKELNKVFIYYRGGWSNNRYFIVEYGENYMVCGDKIVTDKIRFIREIEPMGYIALLLYLLHLYL